MAIDFPNSPVAGSTYTYQGVTYTWIDTSGGSGADGFWKVNTPGTLGPATGPDLDTGTDNALYATAKALEDSTYVKEAVTDALEVRTTALELEVDPLAQLLLDFEAMKVSNPNPNLYLNNGFLVTQRGTGAKTFDFVGDCPYDLVSSKDYVGSTINRGSNGKDYNVQLRRDQVRSNMSVAFPVEISEGPAHELIQGETYTVSCEVYTETASKGYMKLSLVDDWAGTNEDIILDDNTMLPNAVSGTWSLIEHTFTMPSISHKMFLIEAGSNGVSFPANSGCFVRKVKFERGAIRTGLPVVGEAVQLSSLQRYYQTNSLTRLANLVYSDGTANEDKRSTFADFPVTMAGNPVLVETSYEGAWMTTIEHATSEGVRWYGPHNSPGSSVGVTGFKVRAYIGVDF